MYSWIGISRRLGANISRFIMIVNCEHNSWKTLVKDSPIQRSETMKWSFSSAESLAVKRFQCDGWQDLDVIQMFLYIWRLMDFKQTWTWRRWGSLGWIFATHFLLKKGPCHLYHRGSRSRVGPCGSPLGTNWPLNCVTSSMLKGKRHLIDCSVTLALQDWKITEQHSWTFTNIHEPHVLPRREQKVAWRVERSRLESREHRVDYRVEHTLA